MPTEATFCRHGGGQDAEDQTCARAHLLGRFRYFIEHSDWDEVILARKKPVDVLCSAVLLAAALYFLPLASAILWLR
ncbi:MAG: hypothetical protein M0009_08050 [Deltaproteobacteria bacterium]|nr:hypothetical protein [Deltaproteobacteria bacterium]